MLRTILSALVFLLAHETLSAQPTRPYSHEATAELQTSPPRITVRWKPNSQATQTFLYRKQVGDLQWTLTQTLPATDSVYVDSSIQAGTAYEYYISSNTGGGNPDAWAVIGSGIDLPADPNFGPVLLIIDSAYAQPLVGELAAYQEVLSAEGWQVLTSFVHPDSENVQSIKTLITQTRQTHPNLRGVVLLGHIPVPYSGELNPDAHNDHIGAWPADLYYGEFDGNWTDANVNNTSASRSANHNVPGDGKFDPSELAQVGSPVDIFVGRVDFHDLPAFSLSDTLLLQRYLQKNIAFRRGDVAYTRRGLVEDNFGVLSGFEAFAVNGFSAFAGFFGPDSVREEDFRPTLQNNNYLWAYGTGGGSYSSAGGIINSNQLSNDSLQTVFTMLFGSYFGDWDSQNNLMRAALASRGNILTCSWAGRPNWHYHTMGAGRPIGESFLLSVNNTTIGATPQQYAAGFGAGGVHIALMGDPTLRMLPFAGPTAWDTLFTVEDSIRLRWQAAPDTTIDGYFVYRAVHPDSQYIQLTPQPVQDTTWLDTLPIDGLNAYRVYAARLEETASARFWNLSPGLRDTISIDLDTLITQRQEPTAALAAARVFPNPSNGLISLRLPATPPQNANYVVRVFSTGGQELARRPITGRSTTLHLDHLPTGLYLLQLSAGEYSRSFRILIE